MTALSAWPALVLTAGLGTRLRPLSLVRAKAALPVGDEVLVRHVLRWLHAAGVRRVVLNLHHLPETITPYVGDGSDLGLEVRYSWESPVLGSAGGPRRALPLLDADRFLIVNGDTLTNASLSELTERHVATGARVTMTVTTGDTRYGGVLVDDQDIVRGFASAEIPAASAAARTESRASDGETSPKRPTGREGGAYSRFHFVGIQAVDRAAFDRAPDDTPSESVKWLYPRLIAEAPGAVRVYRTSARFHDIGTPADYLDTVRRISGNASGTQIGRDARLDPTARTSGSILWDRVTIGAHAEVVDCIAADDVTIPAGARYRGQVIVAMAGQTVASDI
jgi:NDP-sugar pyrophosphorylase family protein